MSTYIPIYAFVADGLVHRDEIKSLRKCACQILGLLSENN